MSLFSEVKPQWDNVGVEPSGAKKTAGWLLNEKPPAEWFNWLFNRNYKCIDELRTVVDSLNGGALIAGKVEYFAMSSAPAGYLKANGAAISRTTYANLFTAIGTTFGVGDGSTTFNLPDLRGVIARGWDDGRGYDSGRAFGSYQADGNKSHNHTGGTSTTGSHAHSTALYAAGSGSSTGYLGNYQTTLQNATATDSQGNHAHAVSINSDGNTEVTMKNIALLACIKY